MKNQFKNIFFLSHIEIFGVIMFLNIIFFLNLSAQEIKSDELKKHIEILSSDEFQGRKAGEKGADLAADYIRKQFKDIGLVSITDDYFQYFNIVTEIQATEKNQFKSKDSTFKLKKDFIPLSFTSNSTLISQAVFVGYGFDINTENVKWNDFAQVDVKGKWVIMLLGHPELEKSDSKFTNYSDARLKVVIAKDKGANGVIFVAGVSLNKKDELISMVFDKSDKSTDIPVINITRAVANYFISDTNKTIEKLEVELNKIQRPLSFKIPIDIEATTEVNFKKAPTCNVIGMLPSQGSDDYIVIGAHYDHLGYGGLGSGSRKPDTTAVHHGADDNASGVSAVIELARSLKTYELLSSYYPAFKKNIIFVAFSAEEIGILGSNYFVKNSPVDLKKIKAMLNFDMLGRLKDDKTILVGGVGSSVETDSLLDFHFNHSLIKLSKSYQGFGPSDHAPFYAENIPVFFFSTGPHEDYHKPEDDISKINIKGEKEILNIIYSLILDVVKNEKNLTFKEAGPKTRSEKGRYKVTLGFMPEFGDSDKPGVGVAGVTKDSPAEMGGLLKGDRIIAIDGKSVKDIYEYMARLNKLEPGQIINVDVLREDKVIVLMIHL